MEIEAAPEASVAEIIFMSSSIIATVPVGVPPGPATVVLNVMLCPARIVVGVTVIVLAVVSLLTVT